MDHQSASELLGVYVLDACEDGEAAEVRAHVATAAERKRMWPLVVSTYSGYDEYQRRTEREIPLVVLEPR